MNLSKTISQISVILLLISAKAYSNVKLSQVAIVEINRRVPGASLNNTRRNPKLSKPRGGNHFSGCLVTWYHPFRNI
eukprot:snap_masked-scaffold_10-processed-gene-12.28-mRNA-1 protein AED:1.00 eAED:1.00 QI:0/0/0/0/1/1/3/0/76